MALTEHRYASLPEAVRNNLSEEQFLLARVDIVAAGEVIPETTEYIDLGSGVRRIHERGEIAQGDLLPTHDLSGAHGKDSTQWTG